MGTPPQGLMLSIGTPPRRSGCRFGALFAIVIVIHLLTPPSLIDTTIGPSPFFASAETNGCPGGGSSGLSFHHDSGFINNFDTTLVKEDAWYTGQDPFIDSAGVVWLTPDPRELVSTKISNIGRLVYQDPIDPACLLAQSFSTTFSFSILTNGSYGTCGSGMAFFISPSREAPNGSIAGGLGLDVYRTEPFSLLNPLPPPPEPFFAVEFDTRLSPAYNDSSHSHIGIDLNSLVSAAAVDTNNVSFPELYLYNNYRFTTWIDYEAATGSIQVRMTNATASNTSAIPDRPSRPILEFRHNISSIFAAASDRPLYIGFSSTNRPRMVCLEGVALYTWSFSTGVPGPGPGSNHHNSRVLAIAIPVAATTALLLLLAAGLLLFFAIRSSKRKKAKASAAPKCDSTGSRSVARMKELSVVPRYTYRELKSAARGFSRENVVGEGGYSTVYRGTLKDGSVVAMKKLKQTLKEHPVEAEFGKEVEIISRIRHRNLLALKGWCYERGEAVLVYEFMARGSLEAYLCRDPGRRKGRLDSLQRRKILCGVAAALEYLHFGLDECIVHRDVKAANVLLTEEYEPVLADFGLSRLIPHNVAAVTMTVVGTAGYIAPEVVYTGRSTEKADVYSFGVLMLVVACGCPAVDVDVELPPSSSSRRNEEEEKEEEEEQKEEMRVLDWVWLACTSDKLVLALDPTMFDTCVDTLDPDPEELLSGTKTLRLVEEWRCVLHLALLCCHPSPANRPTMRQVSQVLAASTILSLPSMKPAYPPTPDHSVSWPVGSFNSSSVAAASTSSSTLGQQLV